MDSSTPTPHASVVTAEDVARWVVFSGFWGFVFYVLSLISLLVGHRQQPARLHAPTALLGMGIHVGTFVTVGSLGSAANSLIQRKSTTQLAAESVQRENFGNTVAQTGLSAAAGSLMPFGLAAGSLWLAGSVTRTPAFPDGDTIQWPRAAAMNALLTGITAMAVSRIAAWVVRDARR